VRLILKKDEVPSCELDGVPRLGWTSWAKTEPKPEHAGDTILTI